MHGVEPLIIDLNESSDSTDQINEFSDEYQRELRYILKLNGIVNLYIIIILYCKQQGTVVNIAIRYFINKQAYLLILTLIVCYILLTHVHSLLLTLSSNFNKDKPDCVSLAQLSLRSQCKNKSSKGTKCDKGYSPNQQSQHRTPPPILSPTVRSKSH